MVLWNNHLGGLSKVTSYQSQSVCLFFFLTSHPPLTLSFIRFYLCLLLLPQSLNLSPGFTPALLWPSNSMAGHVREAAPPPLDAITD